MTQTDPNMNTNPKSGSADANSRRGTYGMRKGAVRGTAPTQGGNQAKQRIVDQDLAGQPYEMQGGNAKAPSQQMPQVVYVKEPKSKKSPVLWIAIAVAVVCVVLAVILALNMFGSGKSARQGAQGQLDGKTQEEIQAELDRVVEEGMFNISIASYVEFADGTSEGDIRIENVPSNHYLMRVEITRDDTAEKIYETDMIEPDHHIQRDVLDVDLPAGRYDCTATFYAYDTETEELIGQAAADMQIQVLS